MVLDLSGVGFNPSGASQPLQVCIYRIWPPEKIVKMSKKCIADPLWFSHKSSTALVI